jgi:hypothetical protein
MNKFFNIIVLSIILTIPLLAQDKEKAVSTSSESKFREQGINPVLNIDDKFYNFSPYYNFLTAHSNKLIEGDSSTLWLRTELALSYSNVAGKTKKQDYLMLPYYNQYLENSKFNPIRYVLGLAQTAAVGYLAYRHIKKYGFWK